MELWNYVRAGSKTAGSSKLAAGLAHVLKPGQGGSSKQTHQTKESAAAAGGRHEVGTKRGRPALENITNQSKNVSTGNNNNGNHALSTKKKASKKSKTHETTDDKVQQQQQQPTKAQQARRNSYTSRRKRKSIVSDSVVPHFAEMDLSATPTAPEGDKKRSQSKDLIANEVMRLDDGVEDRMEEEILDEEDEEASEEEEERDRDREEKRKDKLLRNKQQEKVRMALAEKDVDALPPGAHNIDALDESDPQWVTAYVDQIYDNLRENENKHLATITDYIGTVQKAVSSSMRGVLVDWLVEVAEEYELSSETLYLSVSFLDRFLSAQTVDRRKFQLVGVTCMLISSKYEEIYAPAIDDFVYISANTYKREDILLMEILILNALAFDLTAATAKIFLRRFLKAAGADLTLAFLSSYLAELTLQEYTFVKYPPSLIAAAAVFLALRTLGREPWTPTLQHYTKYNIAEERFQQCIHELYKVHLAAPSNSLKAIYEKYSDSRFRRVARIPPPVVDPYSGN